MKIDESTNDQLMVIAATRYCLGRQSYIVGACLEWLPEVWGQCVQNTQNVVVRDVLEAIMRGEAGSKTIDEPGWRRFAKWAWERITPAQRKWIASDVAHLGRAVDVIEAKG